MAAESMLQKQILQSLRRPPVTVYQKKLSGPKGPNLREAALEEIIRFLLKRTHAASGKNLKDLAEQRSQLALALLPDFIDAGLNLETGGSKLLAWLINRPSFLDTSFSDFFLALLERCHMGNCGVSSHLSKICQMSAYSSEAINRKETLIRGLIARGARATGEDLRNLANVHAQLATDLLPQFIEAGANLETIGPELLYNIFGRYGFRNATRVNLFIELLKTGVDPNVILERASILQRVLSTFAGTDDERVLKFKMLKGLSDHGAK